MPKKNFNTYSSSFSIIIYFIVFSILGLYFAPNLDINLNPGTKENQFQISYNWPGASAENIEVKVSSVLESMLSRIKGIKEIRSSTNQSSGNIRITFNDNIDPDIARFEISNVVRNTYNELPLGVSYPLINDYSEKNSAIIFSFTSNKPAEYLYDFVNNTVKNSLNGTNGIDEIKITGWKPYVTEIKYDYDLIKQTGLSLNELYTIINESFQIKTIGTTEYIQNNGIKTPIILSIKPLVEELAEIPVKKLNGKIIRLKDIAKIKEKQAPETSHFRINGKNTIALEVYNNDDSNIIKLVGAIKSIIQNIKIPDDIQIIVSFDASRYLIKELRLILTRTALSLLFLFILIYIANKSAKIIFVVFISLLINILTASLVYKLFNLEINIYTLAGISISFGMAIDNVLLMTDQLLKNKSIKIFLAILTASLTTIAVLLFAGTYSQNSMHEINQFSFVIIINLAVSLFVALFFVPALIHKIISKKNTKKTINNLRKTIIFNQYYSKFIVFASKKKYIFILIFIFSFGIPTYKIPHQISGNTLFSQVFNKTAGSNWYRLQAKKHVDLLFGGTLRIFEKKIFENSFLTTPERTSLTISAKMPANIAIKELNLVIIEIEKTINRFDEVEMFKTQINNSGEASIIVFFDKIYENKKFPSYFKEFIINQLIKYDYIDWNITGVGNAFSNSMNPPIRSNTIVLSGYNFEKLNYFASKLKNKIQNNPDISNIWIGGNINKIFREKEKYEFIIQKNDYSIFTNHIKTNNLINELLLLNNPSLAFKIYSNNTLKNITIKSDESLLYNKFQYENMPVLQNDTNIFPSEYLIISKQQVPKEIIKQNQQFQIFVGFNHSMSGRGLENFSNKIAENINAEMPLGFKATVGFGSFTSPKHENKVIFILAAILAVYIICAIAFESLIQPFAAILTIPVSFIGVFITFNIFKLNFDQGGYAAFLLLTGISVNSAIYLINDYNIFRKNAHRSPLKSYIKAFNYKINVIYITVFSTILGLVPFIISEKAEVFWTAFAAVTIGGLIFSFIAIIIFLPIFLNIGSDRQKKINPHY